ncbi:unnamed protein product, partial [Polarella glacialis]
MIHVHQELVHSVTAIMQSGAANKEFDALGKQKERLLSTVSDFVRPLVEGSVTGDDAHRLAESLLAALSKLALDESMMTAIPEAITKEPAARGPFDTS